MNNPDISIIVPCRTADQYLQEKVMTFLNGMSHYKYSYELIFLCSKNDDVTKNTLMQLRKDCSQVKYFIYNGKTTRNDLLVKGLNISSGKYIGFMTKISSMQQYLIAAILELEKGTDMILLKRHFSLSASSFTIIYYLAGAVQRFVIGNLFRIPRFDLFTPYKFFKRERLLWFVQNLPEPGTFSDIQLLKYMVIGKYKIKEIDGLVLKEDI